MAVPSLPLDTPPSGGDRNRGWVLMVVGIIFTTIGTMLVLARLYLRSHIKKNLGLDDLFILLGLVKAASLFSDIRMAKEHRTDLLYRMCILNRRHGSLRCRAPSILHRSLAKIITTITSSHRTASYIRHSNYSLDYVYQGLYMLLPPAYLRNSTVLETLSLLHRRLHGRSQYI